MVRLWKHYDKLLCKCLQINGDCNLTLLSEEKEETEKKLNSVHHGT